MKSPFYTKINTRKRLLFLQGTLTSLFGVSLLFVLDTPSFFLQAMAVVNIFLGGILFGMGLIFRSFNFSKVY